MITLINTLNDILTKGELILHIELTSTAIKSVDMYHCTLYIMCKASDNPIKIYTFSRVFNKGISTKEKDKVITQELLKFVIKGELKEYE